MSRLSIGQSRKKESIPHDSDKIGSAAGIISAAGCGTMAALLVCCMIQTGGAEIQTKPKESVYVMSAVTQAVSTEREVLVMPVKTVSAEAEKSFFDRIGEFFASVIFPEE